MKKWILLLLAVQLLPIAGATAQSKNASAELVFAYGAFGLRKKTVFNGRLEYRMAKKLGIFQPMTGFLVTSEGSTYSYFGINYNVPVYRTLSLSFNFAPGIYSKGPGKELGGVIEFRSGIELGLSLTHDIRIAWSLHHLSNASIYDYNPGVETLMYSMHFNNIF